MHQIMKSSLAALVAAVLIIANLTACTTKPYGTHTLREVNELAEKSGLVYASNIGLGATGFPFEYKLETKVLLSAAANSPDRMSAAVDYILRLVWAQTDADPMGIQSGDAGGFIEIVKLDGTYVDICSFAKDATRDDSFDCGGVDDMLEQLYGRWPGPLPEVPRQFSHLAESSCTEHIPGPYGTYTCEDVSQIASEATGERIRLRDMVGVSLGTNDIVVEATWVDPTHIDYVLRSAWAQTSTKPTGGILLLGAPGVEEGREGSLVYKNTKIHDPFPYAGARIVSGELYFDLAYLEQLYGPWPGPLPEPPAPATPAAPTSASPSPSPSS